MPRSITVDNFQLNRVHLLFDAAGVLRIQAEYFLRSGATVVEHKNADLTAAVAAGDLAAAQDVVNRLAQVIASSEAATYQPASVLAAGIAPPPVEPVAPAGHP